MDPIIILEKVNSLYSTFLGYFLTITVIIAIVYSVLPFILNSIQTKSFEKERTRLDEDIKKEFSKLKSELSDELKNNIETEKKKILEEVNESIVRTNAALSFQQGLRNMENQNFHNSTISFLDALILALQGKDESNAQLCLRGLIDMTLPQINMDSFKDEDLENKINNSLSELEKVNQNGRYTNEIKIIRFLVTEAKSKQAGLINLVQRV